MYTRDNAQFSCLNSISCLTPVCCEKLRCIIRHPIKISSTLVCIENSSHYRRGRNNQHTQNSSTETLKSERLRGGEYMRVLNNKKRVGDFHALPRRPHATMYKRGFPHRSSHSSTCCQEACQCNFSIGLVICTVRCMADVLLRSVNIHFFRKYMLDLLVIHPALFHQFPSRHQSWRE
jgi:hypothetical protein